MTSASWLLASEPGITSVIESRSGIEMIRANAQLHIAMMKNPEAVRDLAKSQFV